MSTPDPRLRVSDADRERAMADLATHYAEGRLEHEEYDERLDAIWTARTRADLAVLFTDLPRPAAAAPPARAPQVQQRRRGRFPLVPVLAVLVALSILLGAHLWLLVIPLWFVLGRHGCASRGPASTRHGHGAMDYRRPRRSHGW